jgi:hypothetical protein
MIDVLFILFLSPIVLFLGYRALLVIISIPTTFEKRKILAVVPRIVVFLGVGFVVFSFSILVLSIKPWGFLLPRAENKIGATKLFNVQVNRYEYVGDDQLDGAVRSGMFKLPAGQTLRVYDPEGNAYDADNRTNFSAIPDARIETNYLRQNRERLEVAAQEPILAGVTAAARGATFGLSDAAAEAFGLAEKFKALKEANPVASTIGEVTGAIWMAVGIVYLFRFRLRRFASSFTNKGPANE